MPYLNAECSFSHPDKVLPLHQGPEAPLQRDNVSEDFPVEQSLEPLTRRLTQENLKGRNHSGPNQVIQGLKYLDKQSQVCSVLRLSKYGTHYQLFITFFFTEEGCF